MLSFRKWIFVGVLIIVLTLLWFKGTGLYELLFVPVGKPHIMSEGPTAADLTSGQLPAIDLSHVTVTTGQLKLQDVTVHYAAARPASAAAGAVSFLLLHGAAFSSDTWRELGTLQTLAALGYTAAAIDLPGPGFRRSQSVGAVSEEGGGRAAWLDSVRLQLELGGRVVVVSPSLSGQYSVPLLLRQPGWLAGYVPVAPVGTELITPQKAAQIKVPVAIVYGSEDRGLGASSLRVLSQIAGAYVVEIPGGGHPAYLHDPALWHRVLHNFASRLQRAG